MENTNLSPEDSLKIIDRAIANYKINYKEHAKRFLLWGWVLALASFSNFFILMVLHNKETYSLMGLYSLGNWALFIVMGFIIQYYVSRNIDRAKIVFSHLDGYIKKLWTVSGISFLVATLICIKLEIAPPPIMLLIAGIATTLSGLLVKFRPLVLGGITFFAGSVATTFLLNEYMALVVGLSIICGYLIPGYFLKSAKE